MAITFNVKEVKERCAGLGLKCKEQTVLANKGTTKEIEGTFWYPLVSTWAMDDILSFFDDEEWRGPEQTVEDYIGELIERRLRDDLSNGARTAMKAGQTSGKLTRKAVSEYNKLAAENPDFLREMEELRQKYAAKAAAQTADAQEA